MPRTKLGLLLLMAACAPASPAVRAGRPLPVLEGEVLGRSGPVGTARVQVEADRATARVELEGVAAGVFPWHLHQGSCATGGDIVGDAEFYPPLRVGSSGVASVTARLPMPLSGATPYHINVHASTSDLGTIVACADLTGPLGPGAEAV